VLGCAAGGNIVRNIPSGATQDQIDVIVNEMIITCARAIAEQQASCTAPNPASNDVVYFNHPCPSGTLTLSVTPPSWITLDSANSRLVGAAGTFTSSSKSAANELAQDALNGYGNQQIGLGTLSCSLPCPSQIGTIASVQSGTEYSYTPTHTAAVQRLVEADIITPKLNFINTALGTVIASPVFKGGRLGCFAASQNHFFLNDANTANNIGVYDQNGGFVATVAYPDAPSDPVYSAAQDRVYVTTLPGFTHVRGVNPTTNAIVSDDNLGANYAAGPQLFNLNERLVFKGFLFFDAMFFFDIPSMALAGNVPIPGGFAGGACYAPNAGKYLVGAFNSGTFNAEVWQINSTTFAVEHVYTPTDIGDGVFTLEYNPVTGKVVGKQAFSGPLLIIDPLALTIVCEIPQVSDINAVIDESTGKIYTGDDGAQQTLIYQ
jgi:hypothetical protein